MPVVLQSSLIFPPTNNIQLPSAPQLSKLYPGDTTATANWTPPVSIGGAPITQYNLYSNGVLVATQVPSNYGFISQIITGLTNGVAVVISIAAVNAGGVGPSAAFASATPGTPNYADPPTNVVATLGPANAQVTLSWTTPLHNGGSAISNYSIGYYTASGGFRSPGLLTSASPYIFDATGLAGTSVEFFINASNSFGIGPYSQPSNAVVPTASTSNVLLYSNGASASTFPAANELNFGATVSRTYNGANVFPGNTQSISVISSAGGGWQPASLWNTIPPNGFDTLPYTYLTIAVNTPLPTHMYFGSHYSRATGNDIGTSTSITQNSAAWQISANTWTTLTLPLSSLGMLNSRNFYKFSVGIDTGGTYYMDNIYWVPGNLGWVFQTNALNSGWTDASFNLGTGSADYTWLPQTLGSGLYSIANPPNAASQFVATSSGSVMTVTSVTSGTINVGDSACWQGNLGGSATPSIVSNGTGSGGVGTYNLSTAQTVGSQNWASAPAQAKITGLKLTSSVVNSTLKITNTSYDISPYLNLTFGVIPTKAGYGYQVQFYNTLGVATGSAVNTGSTYTQHDFGISTGNFTVYNMPFSAFGTLPSTIGGFSIKETSANTSNVTYFSAIGFFS